MILCLVFLLCTVLYFVMKKNYSYWKNKNVPFAKPTFLFGNILPILTGKFQASDFFRNLHHSTNEPYLGLYVFNRPFILIRDLDIIKRVLFTDFEYFKNKSIKTSKHDRIGLNLLIIRRDESWRMARKTVSPIFTPNKLKNMFPLINEVTNDLINYIENIATENSYDFRGVSIKYAVDVMSSCLFGIKANAISDEKSEFLHMTLRFVEYTLSRGIQTISCLFAPQFVDFFDMSFVDRSSMSFMEEIFLKMLRTRKVSRSTRNDFIDVLTKDMINDSNSKFNEENLASLAISFLLAGFETTGTSLSFLCYELGYNQNIQQRLRDEIKNELKDNEKCSYDRIKKLKYLEMVINESLRKYPLLGFLDRLCVKTYKVPDTNLVIEKGTGVYISAMGFHYDEQYFPNPDTFDPERFSTENKELIPECVYMPFGKGLRGCIGARFALLILKVAIIKTIMNFEIYLSEDTQNPMTFDPKGVLLTPKNGVLPLKFKRIQIQE